MTSHRTIDRSDASRRVGGWAPRSLTAAELAEVTKLKAAADAVYEVFLVLERQLPLEDRIDRTDGRYFADRREQYLAMKAAPP